MHGSPCAAVSLSESLKVTDNLQMTGMESLRTPASAQLRCRSIRAGVPRPLSNIELTPLARQRNNNR
jgi:hypothetical protein